MHLTHILKYSFIIMVIIIVTIHTTHVLHYINCYLNWARKSRRLKQGVSYFEGKENHSICCIICHNLWSFRINNNYDVLIM